MGVQRGRKKSPGVVTYHLKIDLIAASLVVLPEILIPIAVLGRLYDKVD
jgi:NADH:ubiquinone oxidoreductase subunit 4 (subunit M)